MRYSIKICYIRKAAHCYHKIREDTSRTRNDIDDEIKRDFKSTITNLINIPKEQNDLKEISQ